MRAQESRGPEGTAPHPTSSQPEPPEPAGGADTRRSVVEEAQAREGHGHSIVVGGGDHLLVSHAAARGDDVLDAARRSQVDRVAEGEEGVRGLGRVRVRNRVRVRVRVGVRVGVGVRVRLRVRLRVRVRVRLQVRVRVRVRVRASLPG